MKVALNPLVSGLKESATLAINTKARQLRSQGQSVCHFGFGQSPFPVPEVMRLAVREHAGEKDYLPTLGLPALREAVAAFYRQTFKMDFSAHNVCIGPGSKELIFQALFQLECTVLIPTPSWVSYGPQAQLLGKAVRTIKTQCSNRYLLQAEELEQQCQALTDTPKLLIINSPNNPTGAVYRQDELESLAAVCRKHNVIVISDEIYAMIDFTDRPFSSMSHYYPEGTIVTGGLSKSFAAGGYRLGIMLIPEQLSVMIDGMKIIASETFSAVASPIQHAALAAYGNFEAVQPFIKKTCEIHRTVAEYIHKRFVAMNLNCPAPEGAFYLFPDFHNYADNLAKINVNTDIELCDRLLNQANIALLPGSEFYREQADLSVRVAYVDYDGGDILSKWPESGPITEAEMAALFPAMVDGCNRLEQFLGQF